MTHMVESLLAENSRLRRSLSEAQEELAEYRRLRPAAERGMDSHPVRLRSVLLTPRMSHALALLMEGRPVRRQQIALANPFSKRDVDDIACDLKSADVLICRLRKKLGPLGISIETAAWGSGQYVIPPDALERLRDEVAA